MANVNELRNKFPSLRNMTDYEIVDLYAKKNGVSPDIVAYDLGVQPKNAPGFTTGLKNSMYGLAQGLGQVANDMYGENSKSPAMRDMAQQLETYGREGMQRNPVTIMDGDGNALQNIGQNLLERPINTVAQIGGAAAGLVLPAAGLKGAVYAARGAQALGTAGKAGLAAGEIATYGTSSYGNMRNSQEEQGANTLEDKLKAAGAALASGAIERFGGVEALVAGKGKASKTLLGTTVKAGGKEAGEEIVQTPIERYGSNKEVFDDTLATDALAGGVAGFIGGAMSGPIEHYTKKPPVNDYEPFQIVGTSADADVRKKVDVTDNIVPASGESLVNTINRTVGVRPTGKPDKNYAKGFMTAYNELSGVRTVDPTTQQERELTVGELFARRAGVSETAEQAPDAASNISQAESAGLQPKAQAKPINLPQAAPWEYKTPEGEAIPTPEFVGATSQKKREAYTTVAEARQQGIIDNNKFEELANSIAQTNKIGKVVNQIKAEIDNIKSWAVPVRPENPTPEAAEQYRQQMESFLTRDLTDVQRADLIAAVGVRKTQEDGTEDAVGHSLRAVAKARGASHTAVAKNVAKAFESIQKRMEAAGIDSDQAMVFLNMDRDAVADVASISTAQAVQAGLAFRNNDYQQPKAVYAESDDRPDYTGEMTAAPAEENFTDVTGAQFGVEPQAQATSNGKRVDAEELADGPEVAQDTDVEFEDQAGAALAAREAEGEVVEAPEAELSQQLRDWRGAPIPEADVLDAADTFNDRAGPDGEAFATLDKDVQNQYIKAYVAFMDGQISDHRFERIFAEIVDEQYRRQTTVKEAETGAVQSEPATGETGTTGQAASSEVGNTDKNSEVSVRRAETQERGTDGAEVAKDTVAAEDMADLLTALKKLSAKGSKHAANAKSYLAQVNSGEDVYMEAKAWVEAVTEDDAKRFSKATPTKGTTVESIEAVVESVSGKGYNPKVRIYKTAAEAVADGHLSKEEAKGTQGWVNGLGHAYFIAENIKPGNELAVFLHEVGAHLGIENLLNDKEYENLFKKIMDWAASDDGSLESRIALAAVNRVEKAVTNDADYAPETIAYFIEEAVKAGVNPIAVEYKTALGRWMAVLMHALKIALKRLGVDLNKLSARDVVNLAYGAAHLELNGGAKVESPDVIEGNRYSKVVDAVPEQFREPAENVVSLLKDKASSTINLVGMTSDLIDAAVKRGLKSAEKWKNLIDERQAERNRNEKEIDNIIQDMDKLDAQRQAAVWSAARDMSKSGKWGYKPTWRPDVEVDAAAAEIYNKLSKDEQVLLDRVFHNGDRSLKEVQSILDEILRDEFDAKMKKATPAQKANVEKEFEKYRKLFGRKLTQLSGPYTPLQGVGSHITVAKSQRYIDVESSGGDLSELRQDPNHFVMVFTKSQVAADAKKRELARRGFDAVNITAKPKREWLSQSDSIPFEAFDKLRKLAANNTSKMSENLNNLITDLYLTSLAETSSRKSEMRREGVLELSPEAVSQAFIARGRAHAHYVSVLKKGKDIADAFADMDAEARNSTDPEVTKYLNEFAKRYANATRFDDSPVVDKLMGFNSVWMLLTKPAYYLYNMTQPFVMSQPLLASKFGYGKAGEAMLAAYQDVLKNKAGLKHPEALPEDVRGAALKLREMGKLDFGMSQDLGSRVSTGNSAASHVVNKVERALRNAAQASEALNRTVTGITAYRLALKSGMSDADAIKYAAKVIDRTQGDYSNFNAPRLFNSSPVARLLTQFRKFQVIQATFIIKNVMDAFKGATPAERAAARATLKYVFGHYAVLAGTLGLPMANVIAYAFNAMDGDDDDDKQDLELQARKALGNGFFADLVLRGAPAAVFNINMSDNVGAGNAFALFPYGEVDMSSRSGYERALVTALGPTAGNGYQVVSALNKLEQGDYYQFSEALMPSGFKAAMKSLREASTGVTNTKGDTLVTPDEVALWDTVVKLVGGKTQSDSVRNLVRGQKYEFERFFKDRGSLIKHQYVKAYRDGDSEGMADARRRWQALQGFKREHGFKADPMSRLFKSIKDANDRNNDMVDGVEVTDRNRGFVEQYTEVTD